jgi:hypothetical protein
MRVRRALLAFALPPKSLDILPPKQAHVARCTLSHGQTAAVGMDADGGRRDTEEPRRVRGCE